MTDYKLMLEQLEAIHASAADLATYAASLRVALAKLTDGQDEAQRSFVWGPPSALEGSDRRH